MSNSAAADDTEAGNDDAFFLGVELRSGSSSNRSSPGNGVGRLERERIGERNADDDDEDGGGESHFLLFICLFL